MLYNNTLWISDIDIIIKSLPEIEQLAGKSVMITGAAGLICSSLVDIFFRFNDTHEKKIRIIAAGRWLVEMATRFGEMVKRDDFTFVEYDASKVNNIINAHADYIIHGASNASPDMIVKEPVETMLSNFLGMKYLLDYAKAQKTKRVLYISSSEVYGEKDGDKPYKEEQYGFIDLLNARNSYSVGKRAAETLCASYAAEYGVESVIVRPGHIYGPTASPYDSRVSSTWAYAAARGEDIVMKSDGKQIRSYCYCLDCASAMLKVLLCGDNNHAYNISNPNSVISIKQMAEYLSEYAGVSLTIEEPSAAEKKGFNPMSNSSLDSTNLLELGWKGWFSPETGFAHTVEILKKQLV